jgi:hypothetical protein
MKDKLLYSNVIKVLRDRFPEFQGYDQWENNQIAYFTFFLDCIVSHFSDDSLLRRAGDFINRMSESDDEDLRGTLDDFFLNLYSQSKDGKIVIDRFLKKLSPRARTRYDINVSLWLKGNQ